MCDCTPYMPKPVIDLIYGKWSTKSDEEEFFCHKKKYTPSAYKEKCLLNLQTTFSIANSEYKWDHLTKEIPLPGNSRSIMIEASNILMTSLEYSTLMFSSLVNFLANMSIWNIPGHSWQLKLNISTCENIFISSGNTSFALWYGISPSFAHLGSRKTPLSEDTYKLKIIHVLNIFRETLGK